MYVVCDIQHKFLCTLQIYASVHMFVAHKSKQNLLTYSTYAIHGLSVFLKTSKRFAPQHHSRIDLFFKNALYLTNTVTVYFVLTPETTFACFAKCDHLLLRIDNSKKTTNKHYAIKLLYKQ